MFPRALLRPLSFLALLCLLLAGPAGSSAYVFCIGSDGHAGFEPFHAGACQEPPSCSAPHHPDHHCDSGDSHAPPCTDIRLSLSTPASRNQAGVATPASVSVLFVISPALCFFPSGPLASHRATAPDRPSQALSIQRVTVLRC